METRIVGAAGLLVLLLVACGSGEGQPDSGEPDTLVNAEDDGTLPDLGPSGCWIQNAFGRCGGEKSADGSCGAPTPVAETCNGSDDDCDGLVDGWDVRDHFWIGCCGADVCFVEPCGADDLKHLACPHGCLDGACLACEPSCGSHDCGPDGCGGSCGTCAGNKVCQAGTCTCVLDHRACCGNAVCEIDSCGGQIREVATCPFGCSGAKCESCTPACGQCGEDGCGGECEACPVGLTCSPAAPPDLPAHCEPISPMSYCCEDWPAMSPLDCGGYVYDYSAPCPCGCSFGTCLECACTPACEGRECGPDGCSGSCGDCPGTKTCQDGTCVDTCTPLHHKACCGNDVCWYDSCGGIEARTAACASGCEEGRCLSCEGSCADRTCGDDGCGGTCGNCASGTACVAGNCQGRTSVSCSDSWDCFGDACVGGRCVARDGWDKGAGVESVITCPGMPEPGPDQAPVFVTLETASCSGPGGFRPCIKDGEFCGRPGVASDFSLDACCKPGESLPSGMICPPATCDLSQNKPYLCRSDADCPAAWGIPHCAGATRPEYGTCGP